MVFVFLKYGEEVVEEIAFQFISISPKIANGSLFPLNYYAVTSHFVWKYD
jgi:hypothetical protein